MKWKENKIKITSLLIVETGGPGDVRRSIDTISIRAKRESLSYQALRRFGSSQKRALAFVFGSKKMNKRRLTFFRESSPLQIQILSVAFIT